MYEYAMIDWVRYDYSLITFLKSYAHLDSATNTSTSVKEYLGKLSHLAVGLAPIQLTKKVRLHNSWYKAKHDVKH